MSRRVALHLVAMVVLGALSVAAFGAAVEWRRGQPLRPRPSPRSQPVGSPAATAVDGIEEAARIGADRLAVGDRGRAMAALDAAARAAQVAHDGVGGRRRWAFAEAVSELADARAAIGRGRPATARQHLVAVVGTMHEARRATGEARALRRVERGAYCGATLLNAHGVRIGEVEAISSDAGGDVAMLRLGGTEDALGFVDLAGSRAAVPTGELLFGRPRPLGPTRVMAPTFATDAKDVERDLTLVAGVEPG